MVEKPQELMAVTSFMANADIVCGGNVPYGLFWLGSVTDRLHIGNRWMAQSGFNTYDNTARMHYPLLPSFDTPDPLSQDYPSLSPYSHCAGNPLSLIDPTGERIVVPSAGTEYEYKETPEDGYCFVDKNGKYPIGTHSFLYDVETALNKIQQGKNGKEMVNYLINHNNTITIEDNSIGKDVEKKAKSNEVYVSDIDAKIYYLSKSEIGGASDFGLNTATTKRPPFIGLAHELAHVEDKWQGSWDKNIWFSYTDENGCLKFVDNTEKQAIYRENQIRLEHGVSIRTHYMHNSTTGRGYPPSSIINYFSDRLILDLLHK